MVSRLYIILLLSLISLNVFSQDCTILTKANNISPDRLCAPVTVTWDIDYTGVNNNGTSVEIQYDWGDGTIDVRDAVNNGGGAWGSTYFHTYNSTGNRCNYRPRATLIINGVLCSSSTQEQIVTVWDDDDHNGGRMRINPSIYPICFGSGDDVQFRDVTRFNCVPPQENDVPNIYTRWVQWEYGTDITMTGLPVTVNGVGQIFPYRAPVITLPGPVTGSGVWSDVINVANDKLVGQYFEITLRNWNYCNPYDDPDIPGPPLDPINGDHDPVITTAIILIVPYPDATIVPMDTMCIENDPIYLTSVNPGGDWSGDGVVGDMFYPLLADTGTHIIRYSMTNYNKCTDWDETTIVVQPSPVVTIDPVPTQYVNDPPVLLTSSVNGGTWGDAGLDGIFVPEEVGLGTHMVTYETLPDKYGCIGYDTIYIDVILPPLPIAEFSPDTSGCSTLPVQFINTSLHADTYVWDFGDGTYSDEENPQHIYYLPGEYLVKLIARSVAGESVFYGYVTVYVNPVVMFDVYPLEITRIDQIIKTINNTLYGDFYEWDFGDDTYSNEFDPIHQYHSEGVFTVTLIATTIYGCTDTLSFRSDISVSFNIGRMIFPNVFKLNPNGPTGGYWTENSIDNSIFHPRAQNVLEFNMIIYSRWGELLYETNELYKGWDGYVKDGYPATQGVYVYKATGKYINGATFNITGDVTLLYIE